ncbi:MAG: hypothetical protein JJT99_01865 [Rhodobacteraceae bacterium]|nr:hypothetical protein [Paracoccaceae bacterium]
MARPFLRGVLAGMVLLSLVFSGWSLWHLTRLPVGNWLVERTEAQLVAAYDRVLLREATPAALGEAITDRLQAAPRNWVALEGLVGLAQAQGVALAPDVQAAYDTARAQDFGALARSRACASCAYDLRQCTMGADLGCGLAVNLTVAGDVLSLSRESAAYLRGDPVDQVDVTLSFIGIGATGLVIATGGSSYLVKAGSGLLKVAHRMGRLTPDLRGVYARGFRQGVDWARLPGIRNADDLATITRPEALRPAMQVSEHLGAVNRQIGARATLHVVAHIDSVSDAQRMARATAALGPRSVGALELLGKSRFLRVGLRLADHIWGLISGIVAAVMAALGLIWSRLLRMLRRRI